LEVEALETAEGEGNYSGKRGAPNLLGGKHPKKNLKNKELNYFKN
jgi:hypothetical protein